jgi:hypothetical protein
MEIQDQAALAVEHRSLPKTVTREHLGPEMAGSIPYLRK